MHDKNLIIPQPIHYKICSCLMFSNKNHIRMTVVSIAKRISLYSRLLIQLVSSQLKYRRVNYLSINCYMLEVQGCTKPEWEKCGATIIQCAFDCGKTCIPCIANTIVECLNCIIPSDVIKEIGIVL